MKTGDAIFATGILGFATFLIYSGHGEFVAFGILFLIALWMFL